MQDSGSFSMPSSSPVSPAPTRRRTLPIAAAFLVGTLLLGGGALGAGYRVASGRLANDAAHIALGVRIAGVAVGGLTPDEAHEKARGWARTQSARPVTFRAPVSGKQWNLTLAEVGGRFDVDPAVQKAFAVGKKANWWDTLLHGTREWDVDVAPDFHLNEKQVERSIARIAKTVNTPPRSAKAKVTAEGTLELVKQEEKGIAVDVAATKAALLQKGPESLRNGGEAALVIRETKPLVTAADFGKVGTLIGSFHTGYGSSSSARRHNVETAAAHINGTLLGPGEVFSYNDIVGPRTRELGWLDAPTYQDGQVVPGPGGGVCQVSTTLYNAVLRAGLKIVQRSHHSMPVHYVDAGCDATVAYGDIDFRFANTTDAPLLVMAKTEGGKLTFNLFGAAPEKPFKAEVLSTDRHNNANGSFSVTTYRIFSWADGTTTRERLSNDTYMPYNPDNAKKAAPKKRPAPKTKPSPKATHDDSLPTRPTAEENPV